jgi:biopolymer transport protein ExbD
MIDFGEHIEEKKALDMTPMLDVVFLLLIFFMLTSIFAKPMLPLDLPEAATGKIEQEAEVTVAIRADGSVHLNGNPTSPAQLTAALASLFGSGRSKDLSLQSDKGVPFGRVVEVMDLAKQAGAENISVVTERKR